MPPLVASKHSAPELKERIRKLLLSMHRDPEGQEILNELMIDRFIAPKEKWYDTIRQMKHTLALLGEKSYAIPKP
jgi:phosphonate transport system substrate-binding protein